MAEELLTLQQIADELNLSPSTIRYYRKTYKEFMPGVKAGRYEKFQPEAIEIMKLIAEGYSNNLQQYEIRKALSAEYALNIEQTETKPAATTTTATKQQQSEIEFLRELVKRQQAIIEELSRRQLPAGKRRSWWPWRKGKH
jgi:DNA-binding transcriptional MerR regulator